jgi:hypothetical protein
MNTRISVEIQELHEYGTILKIGDTEVADQFEDFLTEHRFVLFNVKFEPDGVSFYFGQASSAARVRDLYNVFSRDVLGR